MLHVNDMLVAKDMIEVKMVKDLLKGDFEMKDLGVVKRIHGMEIIRNRSNKSLCSF